MARAAKPIELQTKHLTKEEIAKRKDAEQKLKGDDALVYKPPKHLKPEEKKIYRFLVKELQASGILCNLDIMILEQTVDSVCRLKECKALIDQYGILLKKGNDEFAKNPACTAYKDYNSIFNKCCMELGLSPSARAKLAQVNINAKETEEDPLLKALRGD
ncbi:phage terminase small subunit P27 family [Desulfitobacterium sp. PCE1]|uniref:phage terminase small subunit P27 family n=1 Tax=Desulfitobacterium sp. PCE1 TaxID=146907 RepID=UPI00035F733C|nr:phage terminase small subunit P27 family [Desulfitobacterium sp. PCE1]